MPNRVIDAHQHFWDRTTGNYPWMEGEAMLPLRRNFAPRDLLPLMDKSGVDATIIVQCRHDHAESSDLLAIAATHDFVAGVVGWVDLQAEDVSRQIAALRARPGGGRLVGIRHNVHDEPDADWLRRPTVRRGVSAVVDAGLTFDLLVRARELPAAIDLVRRFPEGRFVLDHMAKPPIASGFSIPWRTAFVEIAGFRNVWCKVSGLVTEGNWTDWAAADFDAYMSLALESFGPGRLIFGSDWPVCTLAATYPDVKAIASRFVETSSELANRFFSLNAIDACRLPTRI
jgi:L-fuconolactonase